MLRLAVCQTDVQWCDKERNTLRAEALISTTDADVVLFPEMFLTGFGAEAAAVAEPTNNSPSIERLRNAAVRSGKVVAGTLAVLDGGTFRNRFVWLTPDGKADFYDKRHTFTIGGESVNFTKGSVRKIFRWGGVRFLPEVCYDLRFPVWSRNRGDYDVALYASSWPAPRSAVFEALLTARAIENSAYVAGVNRIGQDCLSTYSGGSRIVDFRGVTLASVEDSAEGTATALIDTDALEAFRRKFPVADDADSFTLNL